MTYDPHDTDADGVVEADVDNQSVDTQRGSVDVLDRPEADQWPASPRQPEVDGPLSLAPKAGVSNPWLTATEVSNNTALSANFVADHVVYPRGDGTIDHFFEIEYGTSSYAIGHVPSVGGVKNNGDISVVIDDGTAKAHPLVSKFADAYYMTPEVSTTGVHIYKATDSDYPTTWTLTETLDTAPFNFDPRDPVLFWWDGRYWIFTSEGTRDFDAFYSDAVDDPAKTPPTGLSWSAHPNNPLITDAEPLGRPITRENHFISWHMSANRDAVRPFLVTDLTTSTFSATEMAGSPVVQATTNGDWSQSAMHHVDPVLADVTGQNLVAVDGKDAGGTWTLGLYQFADAPPTATEAYLSSAQTITDATYEKIIFDKVRHDYRGGYDTTNNEFVVPESGLYEITAKVQRPNTLAGTTPYRIQPRLYNETTATEIDIATTRADSAGRISALYPAKQLYLTEGDRISLYVYIDSGANEDIAGGSTWINFKQIDR